MYGLDSGDLLRLALLSGITGFVCFCASYSVSVWLKRNRSNKASRCLVLRVGVGFTVLGIAGAVVCWTVAEFQTRSGVVDGSDLFVVHAKRDASIQGVAHEGAINEGDIIAELRHPSMEGQMAVLDNQIKEARARIEALHARALPIDQVLLQKQAHLRAEIDQQRHFRFDLKKSMREFERDQLALLTAWSRERGERESELAGAKKSLETSIQQINIARTQLERASDLRRGGSITVNTVEDRTQSMIAMQAERNRQIVTQLENERRIDLVNERYGHSNNAFTTQLKSISEDERAVVDRTALLSSEQQRVEAMILSDRDRAKVLTEREIEAAQYQLAALVSERQKNVSMSQIKAPFDGQVVYRHPSPGLAADNSPVLAMSSGSGFTARVWMSPADTDEVAHEGEVKFGLENAVLTKYFTGRFRKADVAPFESRMIAHFDAKLPIEAITALGMTAEPLRVRLLWRPPMLKSLPYRGSVILALVGFILIALSGLRSRKPESASALDLGNIAPPILVERNASDSVDRKVKL